MKIILAGASGKIGVAVDKALATDHEIIRVGASSGDIKCNYTDAQSVQSMFDQAGEYDALVVVVGRDTQFAPFEELTDDHYRYGFERKFLGQLRLVSMGQATISEGGSMTLTSGFLTHYPNPYSIATGPINSTVDTFVQNAAPLMPRSIRLNVVSPAPVVEPGQEKEGLVTAEQTAKFYVQAIQGDMSGQILRAWGGLPEPRA